MFLFCFVCLFVVVFFVCFFGSSSITTTTILLKAHLTLPKYPYGQFARVCRYIRLIIIIIIIIIISSRSKLELNQSD